MKPTYTWTNQALALLGTDTDRAVAAKLGITIGVVSSKRTRLNIKPSRSKGAPEHGALPAAPKAAPKEQSTPKVKFWTVDRIKLLGTKSDYELGRIWGVSNKRVTKNGLSCKSRLSTPTPALSGLKTKLRCSAPCRTRGWPNYLGSAGAA